MSSILIDTGAPYFPMNKDDSANKKTDYTFNQTGITLPEDKSSKYGKDAVLKEEQEKVKKKFDEAIKGTYTPTTDSTPKNTTKSSPAKVIRKTMSSDYVKTYTSYSGHDMVCTFEIPLINGGSIFKTVGELQTISYSIHNEKMPVRVLGDMNMKSTVFSSRTVAGSMVFIVFDRYWAKDMMEEYLQAIGSNAHVLIDEMPPFNITISMANEYGHNSILVIYGVTFVNEGQVMSIQDIYTENTFQFLAKDVDYLTNTVDKSSGGNDDTQLLPTASKKIDYLNDAPVDYVKELEKNKDLLSTSPVVEKYQFDTSEKKLKEYDSLEEYEKNYLNKIYEKKMEELKKENTVQDQSSSNTNDYKFSVLEYKGKDYTSGKDQYLSDSNNVLSEYLKATMQASEYYKSKKEAAK